MLLIEVLVLLTVNQALAQSKRGNKASAKTSLPGKEVLPPGTEQRSISIPGMPSVNVSLLEKTFIPTRSATLAEQKASDDMRLYLLKNTLVTCNDGTAAG